MRSAARASETMLVGQMLLASAITLVFFALAAPVPGSGDRYSDVDIYFRYAGAILQGAIPYVDLAIEYPPLALLPIVVPRLSVDGGGVDLVTYATRFLALNVILAGSVGIVVARSRMLPRPADLVAAYLPFAVLLTPFILWRYDIFPAALSLLAFVGVLGGRPVLAGITLGAAILAKVYAFPLVVVFAAWQLTEGDRRGAARFVGTTALVCGAALAPYALPGIAPTFLWYQLGRGIQVESLYGGLAGIGRLLGVPATIESAFGAHQIQSAWTPVLALLAQLAMPLVVGVVVVAAWLRLVNGRGQPDGQRRSDVAAFTSAALLAVIVTNKVLSPQYLVWVLPFAPFLPLGPRAILLAATVLTVINFPFLYQDLLSGDALAVLMVNLRNGMLVVALAWLLIQHWPRSLR